MQVLKDCLLPKRTFSDKITDLLTESIQCIKEKTNNSTNTFHGNVKDTKMHKFKFVIFDVYKWPKSSDKYNKDQDNIPVLM